MIVHIFVLASWPLLCQALQAQQAPSQKRNLSVPPLPVETPGQRDVKANCVDVEPPMNWLQNSCQMLLAGGNCNAPWFMATGLCNKTCARCYTGKAKQTPSQKRNFSVPPLPVETLGQRDVEAKAVEPPYCYSWCEFHPQPWETHKCRWANCSTCEPCLKKKTSGRNVVFILLDDMNTDIGHLVGKDSVSHPQAKTPHMDAFSKSAVSFKRAYSNHPLCAPSRASLFSGIYGHKSNNMYFRAWFKNTMLKASRNMMEHFKAHGYNVIGTGKVNHHEGLNSIWTYFYNKVDYGPTASDGTRQVAHPLTPEGLRDNPIDLNFAPLSEVPFDGQNGAGWVVNEPNLPWDEVPRGMYPWRYVSENDRDLMPDEVNAAWAAKQIKELAKNNAQQPFFLAVGFTKPHAPLYCPKSYFDMFPLESLEVPKRGTGPYRFEDMTNRSELGYKYYDGLIKSVGNREKALQSFIQAYLACVAQVDEQIGIVIDAVDGSPFKDNTIVIVTSDHGFNKGQHNYLYKNSAFEETARVPLMIRAPGVTPVNGGQNGVPVSLMDIYPTLLDLCELSTDTKKEPTGGDLDGHTLRALLEEPARDTWSGPPGALTVVNTCLDKDYAENDFSPGSKLPPCYDDMLFQHYSIRTVRWRYTLYSYGRAEELFDHNQDPHELRNLADEKEYEHTITSLLDLMRETSGMKGLSRHK